MKLKTPQTYGALAIFAVAGTLLATAAIADRAGPGPGGPDGMRGEGPFPMFDFAAVDADADGKVTEAEVTAWRAARVASIDANADGLLSVDEIKAMHMAEAETRATEAATRMVADHDTNGDGLLTAAEIGTPPIPAPLFDRVDADGDGAITQAELDAMKEMRRDRPLPPHLRWWRH